MRADFVHSELTNIDQPVPLQPPLRGALELKYQGSAFRASAEVVHAWVMSASEVKTANKNTGLVL